MSEPAEPSARAQGAVGTPGDGGIGKERLSRARILATAVDLIDAHGLRELSMRRLGRALGVEAMALYRYLPSRDLLLDAVVETVVDGMHADPDVQLLPTDGWEDYLRRLAHGVRRVALDHPQVFPLIATRPPAAPWIRPPLRSLRWVDSFLQGLLSRGFTDGSAIYAYRAFTTFLLGHLLLEVGAMGVDTGPVADPERRPVALSLDAYPNVHRLARHLAENSSGQEFDDALGNLLTRIAAVRSDQGAVPPRTG